MSRTVWIQIFALSPREDFVCRGLIQNMTYKEIAGLLDLSTPTIKTLAQRAMDKFGVSDWRSLARSYSLACELASVSSGSVHTLPHTTQPSGLLSD